MSESNHVLTPVTPVNVVVGGSSSQNSADTDNGEVERLVFF